MVIYIAALQGVPEHLEEAAAIDGAHADQPVAIKWLSIAPVPNES